MTYDKYFKENKPTLSINSLKSYSASLRKLAKETGIKIETPKDVIDNIDKIVKSYDDMKYNSRKTHVSALISFIDNGSDESKKALEKLRKILFSDVNSYNEYIASQKKSEAQDENWVPWEDVIKRYQSFEKEVAPLWKLKDSELSKGNYNKLKMFVLLSCYVLIPPRRALDYIAFKIRNINEAKDNFMKGKKFIFNNYKTARTYGKNEVEINPKLHSIIKKWIAINPSDYLITGNTDKHKPITAPMLTNMLNAFFDKRVSVNLLRHSFLTNLYKDIPALKDMKETASDMAHDIEMALSYVKK
jgi:integrase